MMELCYGRRAKDLDHRYLDSSASSPSVILKCRLPLSEIVTDFFSLLKSKSSGYASFEYARPCFCICVTEWILVMKTRDTKGVLYQRYICSELVKWVLISVI